MTTTMEPSSPEVNESPTALDASAHKLAALPLVISPERNHVLAEILSKASDIETAFTDLQQTKEIRERAIASTLTKIDSLTWEVWRLESGLPVDLVGILTLQDIVPESDATAHYIFFDRNLSGKTTLLNNMIDWVFSDHEDVGWKALRRLTVEVPAHAHALATHAQKKLKFGGPFEHRVGGRTLHVEGVKRAARMWNGKPQEELIMGRLADAAS